jgi:hypothetical protein
VLGGVKQGGVIDDDDDDDALQSTFSAASLQRMIELLCAPWDGS